MTAFPDVYLLPALVNKTSRSEIGQFMTMCCIKTVIFRRGREYEVLIKDFGAHHIILNDRDEK